MNHPLNEGVGRVAEAVVEVTGPYEEVVGEGGLGVFITSEPKR